MKIPKLCWLYQALVWLTKLSQAREELDAAFCVANHENMRQEIEVHLEKSGDTKFVGSATVMEAKHKIYKECLGFEDFKNYDGVRFGFINFYSDRP